MSNQNKSGFTDDSISMEAEVSKPGMSKVIPFMFKEGGCVGIFMASFLGVLLVLGIATYFGIEVDSAPPALTICLFVFGAYAGISAYYGHMASKYSKEYEEQEENDCL